MDSRTCQVHTIQILSPAAFRYATDMIVGGYLDSADNLSEPFFAAAEGAGFTLTPLVSGAVLGGIHAAAAAWRNGGQLRSTEAEGRAAATRSGYVYADEPDPAYYITQAKAQVDALK